MSKTIAVMGVSGAGKTSSLRNLDPDTTFYIDCDGKGMTWKNWKQDYNREKGNYVKTNYPSLVERCLQHLNGKETNSRGELVDSENKKGLKYKVCVIDTINGIMIGEEQRNRKLKGYDKWDDLANAIWSILEYSLVSRDDLIIVFMAHAETVSDDNGMIETHILTNGRKLRKMVPESKINTVLLAEVNEDGKHVFVSSRQNTTAKEGFIGAFEEPVMDNDLAEVIKVLEEY